VEAEPDRRQRLYRISAIVLKRREMGEADRLLTVLTRERGKLTLLAKGVRKSASRKAGHIEPFTHVDLLVAKGKSLDLVTQAETLGAHRNLREDLWRSSWAYYVAELADAFIQDEDPTSCCLIWCWRRFGGWTGRGSSDGRALLRAPSLVVSRLPTAIVSVCSVWGTAQGRDELLSLERGGALCPQHGAHQVGTTVLPLPVLKVLRFLQTRSWQQVSRVRPSPEVSRQVEAVLEQYIAYHLERGLRSPVFLLRLKQSLVHDANP